MLWGTGRVWNIVFFWGGGGVCGTRQLCPPVLLVVCVVRLVELTCSVWCLCVDAPDPAADATAAATAAAAGLAGEEEEGGGVG